MKSKTELVDAGDRLLAAAHEYWGIFQKERGSCAVVWLEGTDGKAVLFTRGEHKETLMLSILNNKIETHFFPMPDDSFELDNYLAE